MTTATLLTTVLLFLQPVQAPPTFSAKLHAANAAIAPGSATEIAVVIEASPPWHYYHPILLDTGMPTRVEFHAPAGVRVSALRFPTPRFGKVKGLEDEDKIEYLEYTGRIVALATLTVDRTLAPGATIELSARVSGLACIEQCVPVEADAKLELPVAAEMGAPGEGKLFEQARAALPPSLAKAPYIEGSTLAVSKDKIGIDESAEIVATIRVKSGHHVQDRDPGNDDLIASRLFIEKLDGVELAKEKDQIWDKAHVREMKYFGKVREQSGEFKIRVPFKITDQEFPSGPVALRVLFQYQCCSDAGQGYAPEMAEAWVRFVADTGNAAVAGAAIEPPEPDHHASTATETETSDALKPVERAEGDGVQVPALTDADWENGIPWQTWKPGLPEALAAQGRLVYTDFTATWCLTCQYNKKAVLETELIRSKMRDMGVIPLKADFTNRNAEMQEAIQRHGRTTVPLNTIHAAGEPDVVAVLPPVLTQELVIRALDNPAEFSHEEHQTLFLALIAGFLGGLILNVMPCVLPVISIKVLSFVQQAGEDRGRILRLGLAFSAGIMVWFWIFAALTAQGNIPWQYPQVVIALSAIIFVFALNLFGVFEVMLPGRAAGTLDALGHREGYTGAFLKGLLATLLGTACTAPFLAGAAAYAVSQPATTVFLVFTAAGLGMASPYLLLSAQPGWLKFVPKPGAWMVTFKQATGFVLLGTAVWLLSILAEQLDGQGIVWTVAFFGFLAVAAWMVGQIKPTWSLGARATLWLASTGVALLGFYFCYFWMYDWPGASVVSH